LLTLTDGRNQVTKWNYDTEGRVTNKVDAANAEIFRYKYDAEARLTNRWTAAKGDTAYRYDPVGNLTNVDYPGSLMDIALQYDPLDRLTNVVDALGTTRFGYTAAGQLLSEDGPWAEDTVSYGYRDRRRTLMSVLQPNASPWAQSYAYDGIARLTNAVSAAGGFGYEYGGYASDLIPFLYLPGHAPSSQRFVQNTYDTLARLTGTGLYTPFASPANGHGYAYNAAHQRTRQVFTAGNYIDYTYDKIGQLKTATGWEADTTTARLEEKFGYEYDAAWNLNRRTNNALVQTFNTDNRNQLSTATRTGTLTVAGDTSQPGASISSVTVSGTGLSSGAANVYADGRWARAGATLADGNNSYTATAEDTYGRTDQDSVSVNLPATVNFSSTTTRTS
jgi:YD repeat-containing protein